MHWFSTRLRGDQRTIVPRAKLEPKLLQRAVDFIVVSQVGIRRRSLSLVEAEDRAGAMILTFRVEGRRDLLDVVVKDNMPVGLAYRD